MKPKPDTGSTMSPTERLYMTLRGRTTPGKLSQLVACHPDSFYVDSYPGKHVWFVYIGRTNHVFAEGKLERQGETRTLKELVDALNEISVYPKTQAGLLQAAKDHGYVASPAFNDTVHVAVGTTQSKVKHVARINEFRQLSGLHRDLRIEARAITRDYPELLAGGVQLTYTHDLAGVGPRRALHRGVDLVASGENYEDLTEQLATQRTGRWSTLVAGVPVAVEDMGAGNVQYAKGIGVSAPKAAPGYDDQSGEEFELTDQELRAWRAKYAS